MEQNNDNNNNFAEALKQYFENTPKEQIEADWKKSEEWDKVGPTVEQYMNVLDSNNVIQQVDFEKEVQARVEFKMNELLTGVKNRVASKYSQAFDMTRKSEASWKAFEELQQMLIKETQMCSPCDFMDNEVKKKAKNISVDNIMKKLEMDLKIRGKIDGMKIHQLAGFIANQIEKAQNY